MKNVKFNKMHYFNIKIYLQLGVWGLKTSFGSSEPKVNCLLEVAVALRQFNPIHKKGAIKFFCFFLIQPKRLTKT